MRRRLEAQYYSLRVYNLFITSYTNKCGLHTHVDAAQAAVFVLHTLKYHVFATRADWLCGGDASGMTHPFSVRARYVWEKTISPLQKG